MRELRVFLAILVIPFLLCSCISAPLNFSEPKKAENTFIGAICPYCGYKGNSYGLSGDEKIPCPSCDRPFLIRHARQIFLDQATQEMLAVLSVSSRLQTPIYTPPKTITGHIQPDYAGGYRYTEETR